VAGLQISQDKGEALLTLVEETPKIEEQQRSDEMVDTMTTVLSRFGFSPVDRNRSRSISIVISFAEYMRLDLKLGDMVKVTIEKD